jgi:menaquinol-cytochrome c reductase iron-sulfur subunit
MTDIESKPESLGRRSFVVRTITAIQALMGATLAFIIGGTTLAPSFSRRDSSWLRAAALDALPENQPVAVTLRVMRQDGYSQVVDRTLVYVVRTGEQDVRVLQSRCTHLGCQTSYDRRSKQIVCPCHGGVFDTHGNVVDGPPPTALPRLETRIEDGQVMVQV